MAGADRHGAPFDFASRFADAIAATTASRATDVDATAPSRGPEPTA